MKKRDPITIPFLFHRIFVAPVFEGDEEKTRLARLLNITFWSVIIATLLLLGGTLLSNNTRINVGLSFFMLITVGGVLYVQLRRGHIRWMTITLASILIMNITLFLLQNGTLRSPITLYYFFVLIMVNLVMGQRAANITLAFISLIVMALLYAETTDLLPAAVTSITVTQAITLIVGFFISTRLINFATVTLDTSLARTRHELAERQKAENALRESEERFRLISSVTSDYTFSSRLDAQGNLKHTLLTGAFETITGYSPDEFLAIGGWQATLHPDDLAQDARDRLILQSNQPLNSKLRIIKKGGEVRWVQIYALPMWDDRENRLIGINGGVRDITESVLADERLKRSEASVRALLDATNDIAFLMTTEGTFLTASKALADSMDMTVDQVIGLNGFEAVRDPQLRAERMEYFEEVRRSGKPVNWIEQRDNVWRDNSIYPVLSPDGVVQAFAVYSYDVTEQKRLELELQSFEQFKAMEQFKARFIADAVHDLATPITGLSTRLYLLERSPERITEHIAALQNQLQHLRNLLDDLRTLSKLDRKQIELIRENHDINQSVKQVFDTYEPVALNKQQSLIMQVDPTLPTVRLDSRHFNRLLVNLVSNAINYTPQNKEIRIETAAETDMVVIRVIDQGIGISETDIPHIFDRFYRSDAARQNVASGTGLGLAITKEVVELHGGTITVVSQVGMGSTFTVRLPLV